jgi:BNR/Asp-box repeat
LFNKLILFLFLIPFIGFSQTQLDIPKSMIFPSPDGFTQTEPIATYHPLNGAFIFASAVTFKVGTFFKSEGIYISTDGGFTWTGNDTCTGSSIFNHGGDPGVVITQNNRLVLSHIALSPIVGMYSNYSDDFGQTWSANNEITGNQTGDKGTIGIDNSSQSSYNGRIYLAWTDVSVTSPAVSSYSADEGETWSTPIIVNPNPPSRCVGGSVDVSNDGIVYVTWSGISSTSPFHEIYAGLAVSTDGGISWTTQQNIFNMYGISGLLSQKNNIKVNGLPQVAVDRSSGIREGWVYIVTTEINNQPAGSDPDIILHRSSDNGTTWSGGIRVNQDDLNNDKIQYFPYLDVDPYGNLNILFYDDRNTTSDSADVFLARSTDGGDSWTEFEIKNTTFQPKPIAGGASGYQGDHISLISNESQLNAFWMADYSGIYQVWSTVIDMNVLGVEDQINDKPNSFSLAQNYPNPFNPTTKIKYSIPSADSPLPGGAGGGSVTLKVYDVLGKEVATLVNEEKPAGEYEVEFNASSAEGGLPSGIYFYTLKVYHANGGAGEFASTKKMILLK